MRNALLSRLRIAAATASRLHRDRRGSVLIIFAAALVPLITLAGVLIDSSRSTTARVDLQNAVDTGVLAAAKLNDADNKRTEIAGKYFRGSLPSGFAGTVTSSAFAVTTGSVSVTGTATATLPTTFGSLIGQPNVTLSVKATALISKPQVRHLDLVMCIDATGSMQNTLTAVKNAATSFESDLNAELTRRNIEKFDSMRVKVVFYRDYGGNTSADTDGYTYKGKFYPPDLTLVGDNPPMKVSSWYPLPAQSSNFSSFVSPEKASGGGDLPESGLECVNEGINSSWTKAGATVVGGTSAGKTITAAFNVIAVWTDADAHAPSHALSLLNPDYPASTVMPRRWDTLAGVQGLTNKWTVNTTMDLNNRMLVFFGNSQTTNWKPVSAWLDFFQGGTLTQGNTQLVTRLADAISTKTKTPTLTQ